MLDLLILGATLIDGTGAPARRGDVGVGEGRIAFVGDGAAANARESLDAAGLCLAPGFIDLHAHSDLQPFLAAPETAKILQGVTTEIVGNCGYSVAPLNARSRPMVAAVMATLGGARDIALDWSTMAEFLGRLERRPLLVNYGTHVAHGTLRATVRGLTDRAPSARDMTRMKNLADAALDAGAFGISSGLLYPPGAYATTEELADLLARAGARGRAYYTHLRDEGDQVLEAIDEALEIGRRSGAAVHIAHLKTLRPANWPKMPDILARLRQARAAGQDVTFDRYPYLAGATTLTSLLPLWAQEGGNDRLLQRLRDPAAQARIADELRARPPRVGAWDAIVVSSVVSAANRELVGRDVAAIAVARGVGPELAMIDICREEEGLAGMIHFSMSEDNLQRLLREPEGGMIASDGLYGDKPHPRTYGTFVRVLGRYVRDLGVLTLEAAVTRMTGRPAARLGLTDRGRLAPGACADLVLFDPATVADRATYAEPKLPPVGVPHVFVNGVAVIRDGEPTGACPGRVLRAGEARAR